MTSLTLSSTQPTLSEAKEDFTKRAEAILGAEDILFKSIDGKESDGQLVWVAEIVLESSELRELRELRSARRPTLATPGAPSGAASLGIPDPPPEVRDLLEKMKTKK
jgi:hypothetical protein